MDEVRQNPLELTLVNVFIEERDPQNLIRIPLAHKNCENYISKDLDIFVRVKEMT